MSRVVNVDSVGRRRNQTRRTIAELLRRLSQKRAVDEDARDMLALIVFCLREIDEGIEQSAIVWEGRDYWVKAERLRQRWRWASDNSGQLAKALIEDDRERIPAAIAGLLPHFSDLRVSRLMRSPQLWRGCYQRLIEEQEQSQAAG